MSIDVKLSGMPRVNAVWLFLLFGHFSAAAEFAGYVTLTSDYVKRGVTQTEGDPAVQLGVDLGFENGLFLGAWGSTVDIGNTPMQQRDLEVNLYAGYGFDLTDTWRMSMSAVAYDYPVASGTVDYDYREFSLAASYDDRLWLEVSYAPDAYGRNWSSTIVDLFIEWPLSSVWSLSGGGGYYDASIARRSSYQYWQFGVTGSFKWIDVDLRYHDSERWVPVVSSPDRGTGRAALTLQIPF